jgi:hypothetical protein
MDAFASPAGIALAAAAVGWPLLAGLAVVVWSKRRAAAAARKAQALDARLKGFYRAVELRGAPERLELVIDTLDEQAQVEAAAQAQAASRGALQTPRRKAPQG